MPHPTANHLNAKLRETLFLVLSREDDLSISAHMGCCDRTVRNKKQELMYKLCGPGPTDFLLIYCAAKNCPELCLALVDEFGKKYPQFVALVLPKRSLTLKASEVNKKELYVWR